MTTDTKLPDELERAIQAYANAIVFHEGVGETRAALVEKIKAYGDQRVAELQQRLSRYENRIGTHSQECWGFGHRHYECAVAEIERLKSAIKD